MLLVVVLGCSDCAATSLKICDRLTAILKASLKVQACRVLPLNLNLVLFKSISHSVTVVFNSTITLCRAALHKFT